MRILSTIQLFLVIFCSDTFAEAELQSVNINRYIPDTPAVCKQRFNRFLGTEQKSNVQFVYGLDIKPTGLKSFSYTLTTVRNWRRTKKIMGFALLDERVGVEHMMQGLNATDSIPCFRFIDKHNMIFLEISKNNNPSMLLVRVNQVLGDWIKVLTPVLHSK